MVEGGGYRSFMIAMQSSGTTASPTENAPTGGKRGMVRDGSVCETALDLDIGSLRATFAMRLSYRLRDDTSICTKLRMAYKGT